MNLLYRRNMMYSQQLYFLWLGWQAMQAIVAAFGQTDGRAVIKATNAYLNQLAASGQAGKDKATALAGFINEDPMMVCSLGLEVEGVTMPIRWLVGDGASYINAPSDISGTETIEKINTKIIIGSGSVGKDCGAFGINYWPNYLYSFFMTGGKMGMNDINAGVQNISLQTNAVLNIETSYSGKYVNLKLNGVDKGTVDAGTLIATPDTTYLQIFSRGANINRVMDGSMAYLQRIKDGNETYNFIPFKSATREGMVDLVNAAFYPNQGTGHFTDAYTLQDGVTPWTPSTP